MAKNKNKRTVEFTEDYAGREKGSEFTCDSMIASSLVHKRKVAKYTGDSLKFNKPEVKTSKVDKLKAKAKSDAGETKPKPKKKKGFLASK